MSRFTNVKHARNYLNKCLFNSCGVDATDDNASNIAIGLYYGDISISKLSKSIKDIESNGGGYLLSEDFGVKPLFKPRRS